MERYREIEKSIIKKYRKEIWSKFIRAIEKYKLIKENDKIAVCISGGKDSFLLAKCMQELKRHGRVNFDLEFIVMNPGYTEKNLNLIKENAEILNIPIHIFESNIFSVVTTQTMGNPCYLCARMRRGYLYNKARELGCNKIALGHHYDDVIETILLSMFYGAEYKTMMPKLHSDNFEGMELIRPLYLIREQSILTWKKSNDLNFLNCACKFTEELQINKEDISKRKQMKELIKRFDNKNIDNNIFKTSENINMNTVIGWHKDNKRYSFLDNYNKKEFILKNDIKLNKNEYYTIVDSTEKNYNINETILLKNNSEVITSVIVGIYLMDENKDDNNIIEIENSNQKNDLAIRIKIL